MPMMIIITLMYLMNYIWITTHNSGNLTCTRRKENLFYCNVQNEQ